MVHHIHIPVRAFRTIIVLYQTWPLWGKVTFWIVVIIAILAFLSDGDGILSGGGDDDNDSGGFGGFGGGSFSGGGASGDF